MMKTYNYIVKYVKENLVISLNVTGYNHKEKWFIFWFIELSEIEKNKLLSFCKRNEFKIEKCALGRYIIYF